MSITSKIQEALAANPGVSWNDLVLQRLRGATGSVDGALNDLWMRWFSANGYGVGSINDRAYAYWKGTGVPFSERNFTYLAYTAFIQISVPSAPIIGVATAGNTTASIMFTAPTNTGNAEITSYRVTSTPDGLIASGAASPIEITGLTNGTAYTFTVAAENAAGFSVESVPSNSVIPTA